MKLIALSDLHGDLVEINPCDVVCICGDIVPLNIQRDIKKSFDWMMDVFFPWCENLSCKRVLWTGGNHDFVLDPSFHSDMKLYHIVTDILASSKVHYLDGEGSYVYDRIQFWGCPYTIGPVGWANYRPEFSDPFIKMPVDTDVVLVHQPPMGLVGTVHQSDRHDYLTNYGSESLTKIISNPAWNTRYLFCGHVHSGFHSEETIGHTKCYNVSIKDEDYKTSYSPLEIDIR